MFLSIQPSSISRGAASLPDIDKYGKRNDLITLIQSFEKKWNCTFTRWLASKLHRPCKHSYPRFFVLGQFCGQQGWWRRPTIWWDGGSVNLHITTILACPLQGRHQPSCGNSTTTTWAFGGVMISDCKPGTSLIVLSVLFWDRSMLWWVVLYYSDRCTATMYK